MNIRVKIFHKILILLLFSFLIVSCYAHDYYLTYYYRSDRGNTYFEKKYLKPIDTVNLSRIALCKRGTFGEGKLSTRGKLNIKIDKVQENIINSLQNHFVFVNTNLKGSSKWASFCKKQNKKEILSDSYKYNLNNTINYNMFLSFKVEYKSSRDSSIDSFYSGAVELLDNDEHVVKYALHLTIFHDYKPIYMDNSGHTMILETQLNENINYDVPKHVIDSLVTKSLEEYRKRLK